MTHIIVGTYAHGRCCHCRLLTLAAAAAAAAATARHQLGSRPPVFCAAADLQITPQQEHSDVRPRRPASASLLLARLLLLALLGLI
jgi:hypothetical protein